MSHRTADPSHNPAELAERLRQSAAWLAWGAERLDAGDAGDVADARRAVTLAEHGLTGRDAQLAQLERVHPDCGCPPGDTLAVCRYHAEGVVRGDPLRSTRTRPRVLRPRAHHRPWRLPLRGA